MFQTITNTQRSEATSLQQYIDNRGVNLRVGLRSITITVGWYNMNEKEGFGYERDGTVVAVKLPKGLWSFSCLQTFIDSKLSDFVSIEICKANRLMTLTVKHKRITMSPGMCEILGIFKVYNANKGWLEPGSYTGDKPVSFAITKTLQVHLEQLNTSYNMCDRAPSTLLKVVEAGNSFFGETVTIDFPHPEFKRLERGYIDELNITVRDDNGQILNNHEFPVSAILEIG